MTLPVKAGIGILTAGSIVGLGYAGNAYLSKEGEKKEEPSNTLQQVTAIDELIKDKFDYILLSTEATGNNDGAQWSANWEKYKTENAKKDTNEDSLQLSGWTRGSKADLISQLKVKCQQLSTSKISNRQDSLYSKVTSYCARGVTIADDIEKLQLKTKILDTSPGDNSKDKGIWGNRVTGKEPLKSHFENLSIVFENASVATIKVGCSSATSKHKTEQKYKEILEAYKAVCVKQEGED